MKSARGPTKRKRRKVSRYVTKPLQLTTKLAVLIPSPPHLFSHRYSQRSRNRSGRLRSSRSRFPHWEDQVSRRPRQERPPSSIRTFLRRGSIPKRHGSIQRSLTSTLFEFRTSNITSRSSKSSLGSQRGRELAPPSCLLLGFDTWVSWLDLSSSGPARGGFAHHGFDHVVYRFSCDPYPRFLSQVKDLGKPRLCERNSEPR